MSKKLSKKQIKSAKGGITTDLPLYVVDGVNSNGAASSSIYGSRGNNGVIIVTTKRDKRSASANADATK